MGTNSENLNILFPVVLWILYILFDIVLVKTKKETDSYICWINFISLISFATLNYFNENRLLISFFGILAGLIYGFFAYYANKYSNLISAQYKNAAIFAIFTAAWFLPFGIVKAFTFAILGIFFALVSEKEEWLQKWGFGFIASSFLMIFNKNILFDLNNINNYRYIFNERILYYLIPSISTFAITKLCKKFPSNLCAILKFSALTSCYMFLFTEANIYFINQKFSTTETISANKINDYLKTLSFIILGYFYSIQIRNLGKSFFERKYDEIFNFISYFPYSLSSATLIITSFMMPDILYNPVINFRTFAILFGTGISIFYKNRTKIDTFGYIAAFLGFLLITLETDKILNIYCPYENLGIITSSIWIIYAGILITFGIFANIKTCKISGLVIVALGLFKIFFLDIIHVDIIYKIIAFFITGIILMATSYYYTRKSK